MITIDLSNKCALITGASQGLGACTARTLHQAGANVVVNYFPDPEGQNARKADQVAAELSTRVATFGADVRYPDDCKRMIEFAKNKFGAVDIVVNNAGIIRDKTIRKMSESDWQDVIDTNLSGVFHVCQAAAESLAEHGRIVNLASISGVVGFFGQANYSSAKAGVIALTKVLSRELAKKNVTVNAVAPGVVLTEMGQSIPESSRNQMLQQIPLSRFGEQEEIANAILFLCSPLAAYITGQTLHVNGGWIG
ncbi:MAG: 3-oxoacyl-ACP reductase FabG [Planctomycetes bacterium]|nr:3-oxoacyl-ACP reductase FabG [Planctomycetota bacterium]